MKDMPQLITEKFIFGIGQTTQRQREDGTWGPARPYPYYTKGLRRRLKLAWGVFTGKYDAFKWMETLND